MLSKKKRGGPPALNQLKPDNKWFAYYKEKFGSQNRYNRDLEDKSGLAIERGGTSSSSRETGQRPCSMKGNDSIVLPITFKRATSHHDDEQCKSPAVGNRERKLDLFQRSISLRGLERDDTRRRASQLSKDTESIYSQKPYAGPAFRRTASLIKDDKHTSLQNSPPAVREVHRNQLNIAPCTDRSRVPVREESRRNLSDSSCLKGALRVVDRPPQAVRKHTPFSDFGYSSVGVGRPSCSEESSSDNSELSLDEAQERCSSYRGQMQRYDGSSCSSSGSVSPLSLTCRLSAMKLRTDPGSRRVPREFDKNTELLQGSSSGDVAGLVGLHNEGNTCYLNSCLQCLAHTLPLASAVLGPYSDLIQKRGSGPRHTVPEREWASLAEFLAYAFHQIIRDMWGRPSYSTVSASIFLQCVQAFAPQFSGAYQHDAQEVLRAILDGLHDALNRVKVSAPYRDLYMDPKPEIELAELTWRYHKSCHDSIIQDIFCGQLQSTIECSACHRNSHCFDPFMDLSLPLPKPDGMLITREQLRSSHPRQRVTLQDCLSAFGAPEQLEGSNKYYCPNCKAPRTSTKKLSIFRLPPVLVLHIKVPFLEFSASTPQPTIKGKVQRFYGVERYSYTKDETPVYYPLRGLDLSNLLGILELYAGSPCSNAGDGCRVKARKVQGSVYDLYAVCCHVGSMGCGHYTAQCKNCDNNVWYCFNDASVNPVQDAAVSHLFSLHPFLSTACSLISYPSTLDLLQRPPCGALPPWKGLYRYQISQKGSKTEVQEYLPGNHIEPLAVA